MFTIDTTVNLSAIVAIVVAGVGGVAFIYAVKASVFGLTEAVKSLVDRISKIEEDIGRLNEIVVANARIEERVSSLRSELTGFITSQLNAHTEWRSWVRGRFDRQENDMRSLELKVLADKVLPPRSNHPS